MEIKYTYKEPEDRPIEKAEFRSTGNARMSIEALKERKEYDVELAITNLTDRNIARFNKADFADFTALVNRINKQIGN